MTPRHHLSPRGALRAIAYAFACALVALPAHAATSTTAASSSSGAPGGPAASATSATNHRHAKSACATAHGNSSRASASSSADAPSPAAARNERAAKVADGSMTSSVTAGPHGLSGTTTMPDGSTVTIAPGQAAPNPSAVASGSSQGGTSASESSAQTGAREANDDDCIDTTPRAGMKRAPRQTSKRSTPQKENQP